MCTDPTPMPRVAVSSLVSAGCRDDCQATIAVWAQKIDTPSRQPCDVRTTALGAGRSLGSPQAQHAAECWCPPGYQDMIDNVYEMCGGCGNWDASNAGTKATAESYGCAGAAKATPAILSAVAAVIGHFSS
jgi:hypothetical protein